MKSTENYRYLPIVPIKAYRYYRYRLSVSQKKKSLTVVGIGISKKKVPITTDKALSLGSLSVIGRYRLPCLVSHDNLYMLTYPNLP